MDSPHFTIPNLVGSLLNDPQNLLVMKKVPQNPQEMEVDLKGMSPAVQALMTDTSLEVVDRVRSYVLGEANFDKSVIAEDNIFSYLAAAKIVDLTIPVSEQKNSTISIRDACLTEPNALKNQKQISLINGYIIPKLNEDRIQFLNRFDDLKDRAIRIEQEELAKTAAYFHRDILPRIEKVFKRSLNAIVESTKYLKDRNLFFAGASGVGKSRSITKFVQELAGHPVDLQNIVYGTDNVKAFLQEEFPACQSSPSFVMAMVLRHTLENAVKTHSVGKVFFLQEGVLSQEPIARKLLEASKELEIRDFDAPFKTIALRALNREHFRKERPIDFKAFAESARLCRNCRSTLINGLSEKQRYEMNYNGTTYTAEEMKKFDYKEPDLLVIGDEKITIDDVSQFDQAIRAYVGLTVRQAFEKLNELIVKGGI